MKFLPEVIAMFPSAPCPRCLGTGHHARTASGYSVCFQCKGDKSLISDQGRALLTEFVASLFLRADEVPDGWYVLGEETLTWKQMLSTQPADDPSNVVLSSSGGSKFLFPRNRLLVCLQSPSTIKTAASQFLSKTHS